MDRMLQRDVPDELSVPESGHGFFRTTFTTILLVMLVAGVWVRFNNQIASVVPFLAGPAEQISEQMGFSHHPRGLLALELLPQTVPAGEVAAMGLGATDAATLSDALQRRRLRLVHMPVLDFSPVLAAGESGHSIEVSSGGYTRLVHLTRAPTTLTLPIAAAGTVTFRAADGDAVSIGALTLAGPVRLPDLQTGESLSVGVVAQ